MKNINVDPKKNLLKINIPVKLFFKIIKYDKLYKVIYFYNIDFFFFFLISNCDCKIKPSINTIVVRFLANDFLKKKLENQIKTILYAMTTYFFKKIKIAGKSYRIEKNGIGFNLTVGHTLDTHIYIYNTIQKQTTKHKLIFYYLNNNKVKQNLFKIIYLRLWDVYTQRGLRFGKHKLFKKQGKKSTYV